MVFFYFGNSTEKSFQLKVLLRMFNVILWLFSFLLSNMKNNIPVFRNKEKQNLVKRLEMIINFLFEILIVLAFFANTFSFIADSCETRQEWCSN